MSWVFEIISRHSSCGNSDGLWSLGYRIFQAERSKGVLDSPCENVREYAGFEFMSGWVQIVKGHAKKL